MQLLIYHLYMISEFIYFRSQIYILNSIRSNVVPIRQQIDELYRNLHQLCDVLESKKEDSKDLNPRYILVSESNELLSDLKNLYRDSDEADQIRIMTISPKRWGREKIRKW